jgi:hypothetical protein
MTDNKNTQRKMFSLWLRSEEYVWLKQKAKAQGQTMTNVIRNLVQHCMEEDRLKENARQPEQY